MGKKFRGILSLIMAMVFTICVAVPAFARDNSTLTFDSKITTTPQDWRKTSDDISDEGIVLMKNAKNTLPLARGTKLNLLGYCGWNPIYSGSGSGAVSSSGATDFKAALQNAGFAVNPAIEVSGIYKSDGTKDQTQVVISDGPTFRQNEVPQSKFTGAVSFENMKKYSDTALVVLGRDAGEGNDLNTYQSVDGRRYLELSKNEEALLSNARRTFGKLIVVINSGNAVEMKQLAKYNPDAVVWVGMPGPYGLASFGKILNGSLNPSGRLVDTWVYDNDAEPSSEWFSINKASNADKTYYVDYVEGIYNGYRFYETAAAEKAKIKNTHTGDVFDYSHYGSVVAYPFGYGLSYTTFDKKLSGGIPKNLKSDSKFDVKVKVKNTGKRAGKDVEEIYVTVPYTKYDKQHGVEKSAVSLVGFAKTKLLQPGESQTVKIPVDMQKLASYDSSVADPNGKKGAYRLDAGEYTFSLRNDAHHAVDAKTANLKKDFVFNGDNKRASDSQAAYNQFDDTTRGEYLSRQNKFANYASAMKSVSSKIKDMTYQNDPDSYGKENDPKLTHEYKKGVDYAAPGNLKFADMKGVPYNDPKWDALMKQLTVEEMNEFITVGLYETMPALSIQKPVTIDSDGPQSWKSFLTQLLAGKNPASYPGIIVLASTWNQGLAYRFGQDMADEGHSYGITGWYAPAMDNHRNAYAGRNYEYYSEDPVVSADMAKNEVLAARQKGMVVFIKHFALNEMENNRGINLHTYSNEQAIREIYLRPFEECVKEGHANAVMGACNMVGDVFANANEHLMTEVLRNEWGFNGLVSTDQCGSPADYWYKSTRSLLRAGTDYWLDYQMIPNKKALKNPSSTDIYYMQRATKHILYTLVNSDCEKVNLPKPNNVVSFIKELVG